MKQSLPVIAVLLSSMPVAAQMPAPAAGSLTRHYRDGETLPYHMTASNDE